MHLRRMQVLLLAMFTCFSAGAIRGPAAPISFTPLGDLPGGEFSSAATAISADGRIVVGHSEFRVGASRLRSQAFRWTKETGMVGLGVLPGAISSQAHAISADGSVIVGTSFFSDSSRDREAFRWTDQEGMTGIFPVGGASGVSGDGSTIVGISAISPQPVTWTESGGVEYPSLIPPFNDFDSARSWDVSADGSVIVGTATVHPVHTPFLVNPAGNVTIIDLEPTFLTDVEYLSISADGTTIAGYVRDFGSSDDEAFRWTSTGGVELLGFPPGEEESNAYDVSADGRVIAGFVGENTGSSSTGRKEAAIWDEVHGWQYVEEILTGAGVDLPGWELTDATAISANGRVIAGFGTNPDGNREAWLAVIVIPEPSTISMCCAVGCAAVGRVRSHR